MERNNSKSSSRKQFQVAPCHDMYLRMISNAFSVQLVVDDYAISICFAGTEINRDPLSNDQHVNQYLHTKHATEK